MPLFRNGKKSSEETNDKIDFSESSFPFLISDSFGFPVKSETKPIEEEPDSKEDLEEILLVEEEPAVLEENNEEPFAIEDEEPEMVSDPVPEEVQNEVPEEVLDEVTEEAQKNEPEEVLDQTPEEANDNVFEETHEETTAAEEVRPPVAKHKAVSSLFSGFRANAPTRSPLLSVLNSVKQTAATTNDNPPALSVTPEIKDKPKLEVKPADETKPTSEEKKTTVVLKPEVISHPEESVPTPVVKTSTLLAKCMPYIYDEDGVNYVEEKPNYTLESVEDIISSVEKKANERIAKMYGIKAAEAEEIKPDVISKPKREEPPKTDFTPKAQAKPNVTKIGQEVKPSSSFDTTSFPKVSGTLFDDFSSRRTEMSDTGPITTTYTQFNDMQSDTDEGHTRVLPDLKLDGNTAEIFEDISSHSISDSNVVELPRFSHKPDIDYSPDETVEEPDIKEFDGAQDIKRVGLELKFNMLSGRIRLIITAILTLLAGAMHIPAAQDFLSATPLFAGIAGLVIFSLAVLVNFNVFASLKTAFGKQAKIEVPLAFALILMGCYLIFKAISANYVYDIIILPLVSLLVYTFCSYLKQNAIWNNFKLVAARTPKTAVALISDPATTSAMARSVIEGDILAAGSRETDEIGDFLKNSFTDHPFQGRLNTFTIAALITSLVVGVVVGISHASFSDAFCAAASVLCLAAAPSLFIADMLPFAGLSRRLFRHKAAVCSKFSAERIELLNAIVLSSADIFPDDCIKLYSMRPLSSNTLDETIALAAAVANEANSPLKNLFLSMLDDDATLPEADSVKYEDNLGISGWADDHHIMIGNRSIMEAHGVRVPSLDVDRKILHKGFFPVYVACDQRACALLTVKYTINREVEYELGRLSDKGVTLLVDNCDPNITEEMLCDYYSLFPDLVKILDHHGVGKYRNAVSPADKISAHGFYKDSAIGFVSLINGCIRLRTVSNALGVVHIIGAVLCWLVYTGISVGGTMALVGGGVAALCSLATLILSLVTYFIGKP